MPSTQDMEKKLRQHKELLADYVKQNEAAKKKGDVEKPIPPWLVAAAKVLEENDKLPPWKQLSTVELYRKVEAAKDNPGSVLKKALSPEEQPAGAPQPSPSGSLRESLNLGADIKKELSGGVSAKDNKMPPLGDSTPNPAAWLQAKTDNFMALPKAQEKASLLKKKEELTAQAAPPTMRPPGR